MTKLFRDKLGMPFIDDDLLIVKKETENYLITEHTYFNELTEYSFIESYEEFLKENLGKIKFKCYQSKDNYGIHSIVCHLKSGNREIDVNFVAMEGRIQISYQYVHEYPLSQKEKEIIKNVIISTKKYLKKDQKLRLKYLNYDYVEMPEIEELFKKE